MVWIIGYQQCRHIYACTIIGLQLAAVNWITVTYNNLFSGAALLVKHLNRCGIPLAVATGSTIHTYQLKISMHSDVFSCFHHVVCSDDNEVVKGKPSPHIYLTAAKRFNTPPSSNKHVRVYVSGNL